MLSVPLAVKYKASYNAKKFLIYFSMAVLAADTIYKTYYGITLQTRQNCVLYKNVPRLVFMLYENVFELFFIVTLGVFVAELINKYFNKIKRIIPGNIFSAFLIASVIPACSCSVIPMIKGMRDKTSLRVILTFVFAAPLLNPYIVAVSVGVLGIKYTLYRILASFVLATSSGIFIEKFLAFSKASAGEFDRCTAKEGCRLASFDIYDSAYNTIKKITPYILLSGILSILYEYYINKQLIMSVDFSNGIVGLVLAVLVGIPIYLCNGADVLFLRPLVAVSHLPLGTAVAFSLTSTAVCISSVIMLSNYLGKRTTAAALLFIILVTFVLGIGINYLQMI